MLFSKFQPVSLLLLVLCGFMLLPTSVEAQEVHALLVIMDSTNTTTGLGNAAKADEAMVRGVLQKVDRVYKTNVKVLYSSAGETTVSNIQREIRALRPRRDDVVLFYFSGHGGMISQTDKRTYLLVTDPTNRDGAILLRSDMEADVNGHDCRLKLIITDSCSNAPLPTSARHYATFGIGTRGTDSKAIRNLFGEHEGLLHVNGATEGQLGWSIDTDRGGIFTDSLITAISGDVDVNEDSFIEWSEVFTFAKRLTGERWDQLKERLLNSLDRTNPDLMRQATRQQPRAYSLPERSNGKSTKPVAELWTLSNPYSGVDVSLETDRDSYRLEDLITFTIRPQKNCYVTLLNWGSSGDLTQLFPNKFSEENRLVAGRTYTFPPRQAPYEFFATDQGVERVKVLVVTDKGASDKINNVFSFSSDSRNPFRGHETGRGQARFGIRETSQLIAKEQEILKILTNLDSDQWGEARVTRRVR